MAIHRCLLVLLAGMLLLGGCASEERTETTATIADTDTTTAGSESEAFVRSIEAAHRADRFRDQHAVAFDIDLRFGGQQRLEGTITLLTSTGKLRLDRADGTTVVFDGDAVHLSPADAEYGGARFDVYTWSYFFAAPYKMDDPGTAWTMQEDQSLGGEVVYDVGKLTFTPGTGDAPDDWYVVYKDPATDRLYAMAYIVTYGRSEEQANEDPHAITYEGYETVNGIPFATRWRFWQWSEADGLGDPLGEATISNIRFLGPDAVDFGAPVYSRAVPPPETTSNQESANQ